MEAGPGPRRHLQMGDSGGPSESSGGHGSAKDLPVMPGPEKPLLHIAIEFVEMLDNALAEHQMLNVAHGELPAEAACIIDVPIDLDLQLVGDLVVHFVILRTPLSRC